MKLRLFVGSGHVNSRCFRLAKYIKDNLENEDTWEIEIVDIPDFPVLECLGCEYCLAHQNECIIKDNMETYYQWFRETDYIIFISPVYFSNIPGTLKKVIDRCQLFYNLKNKDDVKSKKFTAIHVGGARTYPGQFEAFKRTYDVLLPDIKAELSGFVTTGNTDNQDFLLDKDFLDNVLLTVKNTMKRILEEKDG